MSAVTQRLILTLAFVAVVLAALGISKCFAWDGYDDYTGYDVTIERGNLVRRGQEIEVYDWRTGRYHDVTVEDVTSRWGGRQVEIEVYDWQTNDYRTWTFRK